MSSSPSVPARDDAAAAVAKPGTALGIVAAIACTAQFMVVLDSSIVNVALPSTKAGLGLSAGTQGWVVNGYLIAFGGMLLLASRVSDLFGRRPAFLAGLVLFSAASLVGGLAWTPAALLVARVVQGVGAAALAPSSLSLITASHTDPDQRRRAMTWWSVAASSAGAVGLVLGGILTAWLSWRAVMLVNVPIGAALIVASLLALAPLPRSSARRGLDVPGSVAVTVAVAVLV